MRRALVLACLMLATPAAADQIAEVTSPNGRARIALGLSSRGALAYSVTWAGKPVVLDARLAMDLVQGGRLGDGLRVAEVTRRSVDERYPFVSGRQREGRNRCEEATVGFEETSAAGRRLQVVIRAYDDGIAFRYVLPKQPALEHGVDIRAEHSEFRFLANHRAWALQLASFTTSNEREFESVGLQAIKPDWIVGPPLTIEIDGGPVVSILEADLEHYSGLHLAGVEGGTDEARYPTLVTKLASPVSGAGPAVRGAAPLATPWRVLMMADRPVDLTASTLLTNLAPPSRVADTSWIRPGKVAWDWWNGPTVPGATFTVGMNTDTIRHFVDFAAEFGLEYMLIDAGWYGHHRDPSADITRVIPELDLPAIVAHAKSKNVGILLWLNWESVRDQMDAAFPLYEQWGIKGVKIDYMDRKDQEIVAFYHRALRTAAKYHLAVDFHGAYAGAGEERTYPHLLTREGIMGLEYVKWSDRITPGHDVTIPFTRMLSGPMDYTPGGFRNATRETFVPRNDSPLTMGTRAHQLAMYVVYESGLQMLSDTPAAYRGQAGAEFLKIVPAAWDETRPIDGAIGEFVVIARRKGSDWYIGAMAGARARRVTVLLQFLGAGEYRARIFADGPAAATTPTDVAISERAVRAAEPLVLELAAGGGAAVHLAKQ
jgi:alpha-glucosidase